MGDLKHFALPDVGEGLTEAEIVSWKVTPGDVVRINDIIVEIETAKSLVELPSPHAGVVAELLVEEGATVVVGTPIIAVDTGGAGAAGVASTGEATTGGATTAPPHDDMVPDVPEPAADQAVEPGLIGGPAPGGRTSVLVGYGPRTTEAKRRPRKGAAVPEAGSAAMAQHAVQTATTPAPPQTPGVAEAAAETTPVPAGPTRAAAGPTRAAAGPTPPAAPSAGGTRNVRVLAKPPVRKLAKDLGVDLASVVATGPGGILTREDVEAAALATAEDAAGAPPSYAPPSYAQPRSGEPAGEREVRIPVKGVRKLTAQAMVSSAFTAPHVTEFVTVDVTRTMELVERLRTDRELRDVKVSPLVVVMKALLLAVRRHPEVNAAWDDAAQEIVLKRYVNLGIAAATPRGLIVPNIKDADRMSLRELAEALGSLVVTAREGRTPHADMSGGTITITNVGVFGVDTGTPILNPGEAAILCFGAVRWMPWVVESADGARTVEPRQVTQLGLSFDHRLVDGELGSRFIADIAAVLEDPARALAWG